MVRVLLPTGQLDASVSEFKPIKEMVIKLNGKKRLITESVETAFDEEVSGLMFGMGLATRKVGNLSSQTVKEILQEVLEKGYYDFSKLNLVFVKNRKEIMRLGGNTPYYYSSIHEALPHPFFNRVCEDEEPDWEEEPNWDEDDE